MTSLDNSIKANTDASMSEPTSPHSKFEASVMAQVAVSPAALIALITELIEIPVNVGRFTKDCINLARRVGLLKHLLEEIGDSSPPTDTDASSSLTSCQWWSDLVVGLQVAKCLMYSATSFQALKSFDLAKERRLTFNFQSVNWTLERALSNVPYDQFNISVEVREQAELARSQLKRANSRYAYLNADMFSRILSKPVEKYVFTNTKKKVDESDQETVHSSSSVSLAFFLSKEAEEERLEKEEVNKKNSEKLMIPEDFLCPISLEMMTDPVIISTGQTYEKSNIQRWILCGNITCPKTRQKLKSFTLIPNYVLKSLISQWVTTHNVEQPVDDYTNGIILTKNRLITGNISAFRGLVRRLLSESIETCRAALTETRSLSKRSTANRILFARAGAIPVLVMHLTSEDNVTQEIAITCLLNLSIYEDNKERIMDSCGGLTSIVHVLQGGSMEARENAAATLLSLSISDENKIKIGESGAIPALVNLLDNGSVRGKKDAATALFSLCAYQGNKGLAVSAGIVNPLVKILSDSSQWIVDEALTLLLVLASDQEARAAIFEANAIPPLVDCLNKEPRNRENAAAILLSLCKRDNEKLISIGKLGAVVPLMELSRDGTERAKRKAKSLLELLRQVV